MVELDRRLMGEVYMKIVLAKRHLHEAIHESIDSTGTTHNADSRKYYLELAYSEIDQIIEDFRKHVKET